MSDTGLKSRERDFAVVPPKKQGPGADASESRLFSFPNSSRQLRAARTPPRAAPLSLGSALLLLCKQQRNFALLPAEPQHLQEKVETIKKTRDVEDD